MKKIDWLYIPTDSERVKCLYQNDNPINSTPSS